MSQGRLIAAAVAVVAAAIAVPGAIAGGTPIDICKDLQAHGKLTQDYTAAQLEAYRSDTTIQGYCPPLIPQSTSTNSPPPSSGAPAGNTNAPAGTANAPAGTTNAPAGTTKAPAGTTKAPAAATNAPAATAKVLGTSKTVKGGLPFTGLRLVLAVFVAAGLLAGGALLVA